MGLHAVLPDGRVFGALPRMFLYHESHPFEYIALVALTYGVVVTVCVHRFPPLHGWCRGIAICGIMLTTIILASVPGGVLWKIHDMQAGFFTKGARFWGDLLEGAFTGLQIGWLILALSFPYNAIGLLVGYRVTAYAFKIGAHPTLPFPKPHHA